METEGAGVGDSEVEGLWLRVGAALGAVGAEEAVGTSVGAGNDGDGVAWTKLTEKVAVVDTGAAVPVATSTVATFSTDWSG